jgi:hypothetical protein
VKQLDVERAMTRTSSSPLEAQDDILLEPSYAESVRRYHELAEIERTHQWIGYHNGMGDLHTRLATGHYEEAQALIESLHTRYSMAG